MCGRFTQQYTWREIVALYQLTQPALNLQPRYNIAPTTTIDAVIPNSRNHLELVRMRWGLIPSWWKQTAKEAPSTFNARAETVATKPMFRAAFKRSRCVVPASGYYEWKATPTGKQPYYISAADGSVLSFAALWDEWQDIESGDIVKSCTIIVTNAANRRPEQVQQKARYSMTSSARNKSDLGMVIPSARAVRMLSTVSNFVGRSIGSSPGLAPRRTLPARTPVS